MPESTKTDCNKLTLHNQTMQLEEEKYIKVLGAFPCSAHLLQLRSIVFFSLWRLSKKKPDLFVLSSVKKSTEYVQIMRKEQMNLINDLQVSIISPSTTSHLVSISALPDLTPEAH